MVTVAFVIADNNEKGRQGAFAFAVSGWFEKKYLVIFVKVNKFEGTAENVLCLVQTTPNQNNGILQQHRQQPHKPIMNMQPVGNESPRSVAHNFKPSAVSVWPIALGLCERDLHCISSRTLSRAEMAKKKHLEKLKEARARKNSINQPWM